jgi:hypothetical protein
MDGQRFDLLTRAIAASRTRRQALGLLTAAVFVGVRPWRTLAAQGESTCAAGLTYCEEASACVDLGSDMNNCGACGNACTGGLTCFEGQCDCPSGNCPPVTLPNTGTGSAGADSRGASWPAWAVAGAAALAAIGGNRAASRPDRTSDRSS